MISIALTCHFDAAHQLDLPYESPCNRAHGHRYEVAIAASANMLAPTAVTAAASAAVQVDIGTDAPMTLKACSTRIPSVRTSNRSRPTRPSRSRGWGW